VSLLAAWVLFPLIMIAVTVGCGLLLEAVLGIRIPGVLLPATGIAVIIVVGQFLTLGGSIAQLTTPLIVALAVAGYALTWRRRKPTMDWWPAIAAIAVFAVYAAPIVASGEATFAGFIKLDDTATWLAFTDLIMEQGRSVAGLAPSTYEALLSIDLGANSYPIGTFLPLGVGHELVGQDVAWVIQPYMAFLGATLSLALWSIAGPLIESRRIRAAVVFIAAQPALLFGYYLWGGVKEVAVAALIAAGVAFLAFGIREARAREESGAASSGWMHDESVPTLVLLAFVCAAIVGVLGIGGAVWVAPTAAVGLLVVAWSLGPAPALARAVMFGALTAILCIPVLIPGGLSFATGSSLTAGSELGNLIAPLKVWQLAGIWPIGDFRLVPIDHVTTDILIGIALAAATGGVVMAWRARAWGPLTYVLGSLVACLVVAIVGSPWVDGKALAIASPAIPLAAALLGGILWTRGRRVEGGALLAVLAAGVLWSNALAYRDADLAPRGQLSELETIGKLTADEGPTLMTEYEPYGVRHFLRDGDPEGLSELRRRTIPLLNGSPAAPHSYADTDQIELSALLVYRTLVLRRNPSQSRPPAPYQLIWRGKYYEVWQRPVSGGPKVLDHLGLGTVVDPAGQPSCPDVKKLAETAGPNGTLAAVPLQNDVAISLPETQHPASWNEPAFPTSLVPDTPGTLTTPVQISHPGVYSIWLGGSVRPQVDLTVDGREVGSVREELNNTGQYVLLGKSFLTAGQHEVAIEFHGADLHPGSGGQPGPIGPLILSDTDPGDVKVESFPTSDASQLCGQSWDWIEALGPS
jgi:hypothetical protein